MSCTSNEDAGADRIFLEAGRTPLARSYVCDLARIMRESGDPGPLVDRAIKEGKVRTATVLLFAGCAAGFPPRSEQMIFAYPRIDDMFHALLLGLQISGKRADFFLDVADSGACSWERQAMALYAAASLFHPGPWPKRLLISIRLLCRKPIDVGPASLLLAAARLCKDKALRSVLVLLAEFDEEAKSVSASFPIRRMIEGSPVDYLPLRPDPERESPFAFVLANLSRNAFCPCGSGKKYKRCCGASGARGAPAFDETILASLMNIEEFYSLRPGLVAGLDFDRLPMSHLVGAARRLASFRLWDDAERALDALGRRDDLPGDLDEYREELLFEAMETGDPSVVRRILSGFSSDERVDPVARLEADLIEGRSDAFDRMEKLLQRALEDSKSMDAAGITHVLCRHRPAIGVFIGRGLVLDPPSPLEAFGLTESILEARDRLLLDSRDRAVERFIRGRFSFNDEDSWEDETEKSEKARMIRQVEEADRRIAELEGEIEKLRSRAEAKQEDNSGGSGADEPRDPEELARLRRKIETFKARVAEGQAERMALRRRLHRLESTHGKTSESEIQERAEDDNLEIDMDDKPEGKIRFPEFLPSAERGIRSIPFGVGARALKLAASLCAGDDSTWRGVKKLAEVPELRSARVGRSRRLLFSVSGDRIHFEAFIERRDLETYLRQRH